MTCTRCQGGFVALLYDELKCLNCGHRPTPLRPHEMKELRAPERIQIMTPQAKPVTCSRCKALPAPNRKMCQRHLDFYRELMRERSHAPRFNTSVLTRAVYHGTQPIQGV